MTISIAEILKKASSLKTKAEKVEWLQNNNSVALRNVLILMYDKNFKFNIPNIKPPYKPSDYPDSQGMLYREARKLKYFVEGMNDGNLSQLRREQLFIQMLESVDKEDAEILCQMIEQKPIRGLSKTTINEAFGEIIKPVKKSEGKNGKK